MKKTLENKEKFFAQYWGQEVLKATSMQGIHRVGKSFMGKIYPDQYLELKPISQISDEDAEYCIGSVECRLRKNNPNHGDYGMSPSAIFINSIIGNSSYHIGRKEVDYLRSKGYALPWMSLSVEQLIEYGWIKLKED